MRATPSQRLHLPAAMGIPMKPTTTRLSSERRREEVSAIAECRRWSASEFISWCVDQILDLEFLSPENRAWLRELANPNKPNSDLEAMDMLIGEFRQLVEAGKVRLPFTERQQRRLIFMERR